MELSVIIVNYNVRQFLENALASIQKAMSGIEGEILVVDNASDDGSVEMVREKFPDVLLTENKTNTGFAKANNIALKQARGRFFVLINPDTIVQEDTFRVMLDFFKGNPDVGLAGCKILNADGTFQLPCRRSFPTPWVAFTKISGLSAVFPRSRWFGKYNLTYLNPDETYEVDAVSGSFMVISRDVYGKVGGLDETFFMYGEDLDWCYRVKQAGYKVYYVPATKIVHFKGESTRRSDIDEIKTFYRAMQLFVEKHFSRSATVEVLLTTGIVLRAAVAFVAKAGQSLLLAAFDFVLVDLALIFGELLYFGEVFHLPYRAYPIVLTVPSLIVVSSMYSLGLYSNNKNSVSRTGVAVLVSYVVISAMVFFAKDFAFSRAVVLISGVLSLLFLPGWRLVFRLLSPGRAYDGSRKSLFGRRTLIVGTGPSGQELIRKLRERVDGGYNILGFIDVTRRRVGERIAGAEILGSIDNVGKIINEQKISEVIFSTDGLSYGDILSVIARSNSRGVNFRLVPNSLEAIIGKTRIDLLDAIPLVDIEYNIQKPVNRLLKRLFDIVFSSLMLFTLYPLAVVLTLGNGRKNAGVVLKKLLLVPQVLKGNLSFVGRPLDDAPGSSDSGYLPEHEDKGAYLGPLGLTGLVQINHHDDLQQDEVEKYKLYYAKNQSFILDFEIVLKSILLLRRSKGQKNV